MRETVRAFRLGRQRRASESDTLMDVRPLAVGARGNVDILQMLSKAQDEYDKVRVIHGIFVWELCMISACVVLWCSCLFQF